MHIQHAQRFSRRRFLGGTLAGMAGLLGVPPRPVAAEPPPETTHSGWDGPGICGAPLVMAEAFLPGEGFTEAQYVDLHGSSFPQATAAGEIDFGSNFIGPTLTPAGGWCPARAPVGDPRRLLPAVRA